MVWGLPIWEHSENSKEMSILQPEENLNEAFILTKSSVPFQGLYEIMGSDYSQDIEAEYLFFIVKTRTRGPWDLLPWQQDWQTVGLIWTDWIQEARGADE